MIVSPLVRAFVTTMPLIALGIVLFDQDVNGHAHGAPLPQQSPQPNLVATYLGYAPDTGKFTRQQSIIYQFPNSAIFGPGPYPLVMWTGSTFEPFGGKLAQTLLAEMNKRGFVAASVEYPNTEFGLRCIEFVRRAQGIYESTRPTSAIGVLCQLSRVSCTQGVVTAGFSQGGGLAILAKNYAADVRATFVMGVSNYNQLTGTSLAPCLDDQFTAIPAERLTVVNGENDALVGGQVPLMNVSGYTCPIGTFECWSSTGSGAGWYIVRNSQVEDGFADHCYMRLNGCVGLALDWNWQFGLHNWSLQPNLDWLSTFGASRTFFPN